MLLINCPWCGPREELEFRCGGESHIHRPESVEGVSDEDWGHYMFTRLNPRGVHFERWVHTFGCRRWFNVARHTVSHRIAAIYALDMPAPTIVDEREAL